MDPLHAVYLTVGLFVITFFNPGANLFVVVQTSLASGRRAGVLTGLGVALGDAFYSGLGLFGLATLITQCGEIFSLIRIVGGAYLLWFAWCSSMRRHSTPQMSTLQQPISAPWYVFFRRGFYQYFLSNITCRNTNMGTINGLGGDCARINYLASLS